MSKSGMRSAIHVDMENTMQIKTGPRNRAGILDAIRIAHAALTRQAPFDDPHVTAILVGKVTVFFYKYTPEVDDDLLFCDSAKLLKVGTKFATVQYSAYKFKVPLHHLDYVEVSR